MPELLESPYAAHEAAIEALKDVIRTIRVQMEEAATRPELCQGFLIRLAETLRESGY